LKLILFGPPGAGKGTYASKLKEKLGFPHISTGDLVREEIIKKTEIGKTIRKYSEHGDLVPDAIILRLLVKRLNKPDCENGFILDGFPRTLSQAKALEKICDVDLVINFNVSDDIIIKRLSNRLICKQCRAIFNSVTLKPKKDGVCDVCGGLLYKRKDDKPEIINERLKVYKKKTKPLLEYYKKKNLIKNWNFTDPKESPEVIVEKLISTFNLANK
jgi:adenylate kinase